MYQSKHLFEGCGNTQEQTGQCIFTSGLNFYSGMEDVNNSHKEFLVVFSTHFQRRATLTVKSSNGIPRLAFPGFNF